MSAASFVETIARALADDPDAVDVIDSEHRGTSLLEVYMASGDLGHVIGRQGRTATAIRVLAAIAGEKDGKYVQVEFRDGSAGNQ